MEDNYQSNENDLGITLQIARPTDPCRELADRRQRDLPDESHPGSQYFSRQGFSYSKINEDREIILNYYFNNGFPMPPSRRPQSVRPLDPEVRDVTYTVHPGEQVIVDQVFMAGLNHTPFYRAARNPDQARRSPARSIWNTQKKLYDLGIFSQVDTAVQNPESNEREKNVLVTVQEAKRYTFDYGVGLEFQTGQPSSGNNQPEGDTGVSPRVSFGLTRLNFRGRNHTVNLKANVGGLQQRGLISYDAPRLFNNPNWRLTFTAFYDNTVDVTTFTSQRLEGSVQAEQIINKASIMTYRLTYRRVRATDLSQTVSPDQIPLLSQPTRVAIPQLQLYSQQARQRSGNYQGELHHGGRRRGRQSLWFETDFGRC